VRPGQVFVQVLLEPLLGLMRLALGTVAVATGMLDAVVPPTRLALREARAVVSAVTLWEGTADRAGCGREGRRALQGLWRTSMEASTQGGHGRSPGMRALRRAEASACPWWVRGQESMGVSRGGCPRERGRSRGCPPASRRGGALACLRGGMATPLLVIPARCVAWRKVPGTLARRIGEVAVGLCW
jgi:hypothetical protein